MQSSGKSGKSDEIYQPNIRDEEEEILGAKVALLGNFGDGKTSLCNKILFGKSSENIRATRGFNTDTKRYKGKDNGNPIEMDLTWWDVGGQLGTEKINAPQGLRGASVALLCVDINNEKWQADNRQRLNSYKKYLSKQTPIYLVITKADTVDDLNAKKPDIEKFAQENGIQKIFYTSTSDRSNENSKELQDLENSVVYAAFRGNGVIPGSPYLEETAHNTPAKVEVAPPLVEEIKVVSSVQPNSKPLKATVTDKVLQDTAASIISNATSEGKIILSRDEIIEQLKQLGKTHEITVIDKLKILEKVFAIIHANVEKQPPVKNTAWQPTYSLNVNYHSNDLNNIDVLKKLYVDLIAAEPWSTFEKKEVVVDGKKFKQDVSVENSLNKAIRDHVHTESAKALVDFQQTHYKLFKTKETTTRKRINLLEDGAGRPTTNPWVVQFKFHR